MTGRLNIRIVGLTMVGILCAAQGLDSGTALARSAANASFNMKGWNGLYPFNPGPGGMSFLKNDRVMTLASAAVPNKHILTEIVTRKGPSTPIEVKGKRLIAYGCEQHNCGDFNWAMVITNGAKGAVMRVCLHDGEKMGEKSEWYESGRVKARLDGGCPSDFSGG